MQVRTLSPAPKFILDCCVHLIYNRFIEGEITMNYEQVLQALKDEKFVDVGIWSFFGRAMGCGDGCCND